ncbi:Cof subfamily protein (haloacid dehalogenase superfamily) [Pullulanibacillus pueri]|uniref:Stress response protein YhaX n=1 Tax=Pullulanibacillus pueri TaxID=1437324 RepID=A0A8J3ENZ8_9BACL|nr:Cof-type HAD-IIB family hydrolase [Pullulanibacillus pueri]MBM7683416.1 Cof subfamily protein (haloacid dehalogenase superfamily) [Pullulanibacillus pueri]GGH88060.1 stress response protein YhaX [Pullulanibacillus pueri]
MAYRLLALDIDGTLLKNSNRLDRETKEAVQFAMDKGAAVTLVTERNFHSAAKVAKALKLKYPIVTHNGAFISSSIDQPFYTCKIQHDVLLQLVEFLETYQCQVRFSNEKLSVSNRSKQSNLLTKMTIGVSEPLFYPVVYVSSLSDYLRENDDDATDVKVTLYQGNKEEVIQSLADFFPTIQVKEEEDQTLTLSRNGASKFNGLARLAQHVGISLMNTVAVGDSYDDLEMIEKVGLGVAMKNAPEKVRQRADWITRSNDMNGVAYMVKEVFRKQMKSYV